LQALGKGQSEAALMARANMPIAALNNRPVFDADELAGALDVDAAAALARAPLRPPNFEWRNSAPRVGCAPAAVSPLVCDYLILSAAPMMQAARSFNPAAGRAQISSYRTGAAASLGLMQETPALVAVRELLCACAGAGAERGEFLAIISYQPGQEYKAHFDSLLPDAAASGSAFAAGGQRTHTVLINLNEAFTGGETVFPTLNLTVSPRTGQIILFDNTDAAGARHPGALHLGARVNSGVKWLASQWVRQQAYRPDIDRGSAGP
jgi:prolyl 4-hydroxylase